MTAWTLDCHSSESACVSAAAANLRGTPMRPLNQLQTSTRNAPRLPLACPRRRESRTTSARGVKLATATVLAGLVMLLLWGAASKRDSWGNRWVLQRSCKPPSPAGRLSAWGELHNNFTHTILTTSPEAQALFNQVRCNSSDAYIR